jgi:hypothetical protein
MKTNFLKTRAPFALAVILGISGAFLTTSMQSTSGAAAPKTGYIDGDTPCSVPVSCNSTPNANLCQADGQQAFGKANNCTEVLYRQQP